MGSVYVFERVPTSKLTAPLDLSCVAITVLVGKDEQQYTLHKNIAVKTSKFFASAMNRNWTEGNEKTIKLPEVQPRDFKYYSSWLYTGQLLPSGELAIENGRVWYDFLSGFSYGILMPLYVLGQYLLDVHFCNAVIRATMLVSIVKDIDPDESAVKLIWQNTPPGCKMRQVLIRLWARKSNWAGQLSPDLPIEFLSKVFTEMASAVDAGKIPLPGEDNMSGWLDEEGEAVKR